jgi:protein-tyrosine phosphatase
VRTEIYWIETRGPGRLAVMPCPRGSGDLDGEIRALKADGVDILVSLLTPEEEVYLGLEKEADTALRHGIRFTSHPIWDRGIPEDPRRTWALTRELAASYAEGRSIAAHCRMGIGRSPLILASILVHQGLRPEEAWAAIGAARGRPVPDTWEQRLWLDRQASPGPPS